MIVDRDGGRSPGELRGEKAVGRGDATAGAVWPFKEADDERHVAHRRRPHEHAPHERALTTYLYLLYMSIASKFLN